jgi:hypothetical protein
MVNCGFAYIGRVDLHQAIASAYEFRSRSRSRQNEVGIVGSALMGVVSASPNISFPVMQVNNTTTCKTGMSTILPLTGGLQRVSAFVSASSGDSLYLRLQFNITGAATDDFDVIFDIHFPQLEDGASALDYTTFVAGARAACATTLAIPRGAYSLNIQTGAGGAWQPIALSNNDGFIVPVPDIGTLAIENIYAMDADLSAQRQTEFSSVLFAPKWEGCAVGSSFDANGYTWSVQGNASAIYTCQKATNKVSLQRFEVHRGDQASFDNTHAVDRAEVCAQASLPYGTDIWMSYAVMVEPGAPVYNDGAQYKWCILTQMHGEPDPDDPYYVTKLSASPCFALDIVGDVLSIVTRSEPSPGAVATVTRYCDPNFQRGVWHNFVFRFILQRTEVGLLEVWCNGQPIFSDAIPFGFNDPRGPYLKYGIYRGTDSVVTAVQFANLEISQSSLLSRVANPLPVA